MKKNDGICLSRKHGVNPSLLVCPLCGVSSGVALLGALPGDAQAPKRLRDASPCAECITLMKQGFLLVEAEPQTSTNVATVLTGHRWVITLEAASRLFHDVPAGGAAYITKEHAVALGLYEHKPMQEGGEGSVAQ